MSLTMPRSEAGSAPLLVDRELHRRYDRPGPRYTSYPTAPHFERGFGEAEYRSAVAAAATAVAEGSADPALSLYVHIPFCRSLCYYCACSKIVTRRQEKAEHYLRYLTKELALQGALVGGGRPLRQLHLGGGTPTYFNDRQLTTLIEAVGAHFTLAPACEREFSVEVDPREVGSRTMASLAANGFQRLSLGVQDFDPRVQLAVNRLQSFEQTQRVMQDARQAGFDTLAVDLIYGLPLQKVASFRQTLDRVLALDPDQVAVYNYAHLPERVRAQRLIDPATLPAPAEKLELLATTIETLCAAGYRHIGMDHFARPDSRLARAQDSGSLQRNFQGYSTHAALDMIGVGITAIGSVGNCYSQNVDRLQPYYEALDAGRLPVHRGYRLTAEDRLRREVIGSLLCRAAVDFAAVERAHGIVFDHHFGAELEALAPMAADGLLRLREDGIEVLPRGRLLLRNIAMVFDAWLPGDAGRTRYSRTV